MTMNHYENAVKLTAQLYSARDTMRGWHADKYPDKVKEYQGYIRTIMQRSGCDEMTATMEMCKHAQKDSPNAAGAFTVAMILAAYVEMIEPSSTPV